MRDIRDHIAALADTSREDVLPLVRDFVTSALEARGHSRFVDTATDAQLFPIHVDDVSQPGKVVVSEHLPRGQFRELFTLTISFAGEES